MGVKNFNEFVNRINAINEKFADGKCRENHTLKEGDTIYVDGNYYGYRNMCTSAPMIPPGLSGVAITLKGLVKEFDLKVEVDRQYRVTLKTDKPDVYIADLYMVLHERYSELDGRSTTPLFNIITSLNSSRIAYEEQGVDLRLVWDGSVLGMRRSMFKFRRSESYKVADFNPSRVALAAFAGLLLGIETFCSPFGDGEKMCIHLAKDDDVIVSSDTDIYCTDRNLYVIDNIHGAIVGCTTNSVWIRDYRSTQDVRERILKYMGMEHKPEEYPNIFNVISCWLGCDYITRLNKRGPATLYEHLPTLYPQLSKEFFCLMSTEYFDQTRYIQQMATRCFVTNFDILPRVDLDKICMQDVITLHYIFHDIAMNYKGAEKECYKRLSDHLLNGCYVVLPENFEKNLLALEWLLGKDSDGKDVPYILDGVDECLKYLEKQHG